MSTTCTVKDGVGLVIPGGPLLAATADDFRATFGNWLKAEAGLRHVVLDMAKVDALDSSGLGAIVAALKRVAERGGDLKIARLGPRARLVFEITRSHKVFEIHDTVEEALAAAS